MNYQWILAMICHPQNVQKIFLKISDGLHFVQFSIPWQEQVSIFHKSKHKTIFIEVLGHHIYLCHSQAKRSTDYRLMILPRPIILIIR